MVPGNQAVEVLVPPKKRGRPSKPKDPFTEEEPKPKRPRGRPKKHIPDGENATQPQLLDEPTPKRPRGRPPNKNKPPEPPKPKRPRGRPPKTFDNSSAEEPDSDFFFVDNEQQDLDFDISLEV